MLDAAFKGIGEAVLGPVLGPELTSEFASIALDRKTRPPRSGSSYDEGWYGYVYKDLRSELGIPGRRAPTAAATAATAA